MNAPVASSKRCFTAMGPALLILCLLLTGCGRNESPVAAPANQAPVVRDDPEAVPALTDYEHVNPVADKAWDDLLAAGRPMPPAAEWGGRPTPEQLAGWQRANRDRLIAAAKLAREFTQLYPNHPRTRDAFEKEIEFLGMAAQSGATEVVPRLNELEKARLEDPRLSEEQKYELRSKLVQQTAMSHQQEGSTRVLEELEQGTLMLLRDFPHRPEPYELLSVVAANSPSATALKHAQTIIASEAASADVKATARSILIRQANLNRTIKLQFTDVAGREVDLEKLRGKVVLINFWATWGGPSVQELPAILETYSRFHSRGFEVIGISLDTEQEALTKVVAHHNLPWPQYYDGKGWSNEIAQQFSVTSVPTMWLVDKQGIVRDINARVDLAAKVEKFLSEE